MVGKWSCKNPLTIEERIKIKEALNLGLTYRQMGEFVGRNKSVVLRECKRLGSPESYDPHTAQEHFEMIQIKKRKPHGRGFANRRTSQGRILSGV